LRILQRYIWRELAQSFVGVTGALLAILFVYESGAVLARAAEQQYPGAVLMRLLAYGFVQDILLLLPFGTLLAVVLALGRFYHDSEMVAAQACGLGRRRLLAVVMALALPVAALAGLLALRYAPLAAQGQSVMRAEALRAALSVPIAPGQFRSLAEGRIVLYARSAEPDGALRDVFIKRGFGERVETIVARSARTLVAADGLSQIITLSDGERIEGVPGSPVQRIMKFAEQVIPVVLAPVATGAARISELPTRQLVTSRAPAEQAEWQARAGWPLMTLLLAACGVSLARLRPRQGRFARVWLAIVLFAAYAGILQFAGVWLERGRVSPVVGTWWVHLLFLALALWLARRPRARSRA
jgi:lipopolysaccharide export system permease protein